MGYIDLEQKKTYEKLKNRGWYSKWYWYFNNAITSNDNKNDITLLVLLLLLLTTNESSNCNSDNINNVLIIKIIIKTKSGCAQKWKKKD